jgi:peptidoglycan/LPS O-acetylase OafA/YrhL
MRFVAALMVVLVHATYYTSERLDPAIQIYAKGANGVRLFFVISGFVMVASSRKLLGQTGGWRVFAERRILRIVPIYWLVLFFKLVVLATSSGLALHTSLDWPFVIKSFLFIPAYNLDHEIFPLHGVGWTLNFEMFFYSLFTLALMLRIQPILGIAPVLIGLAVMSVFRNASWPVPLFFYANPTVLDFLAGMLIAQWWGTTSTSQSPPAWPPAFAWGLIIAGLGYLFLPFHHSMMPLVDSLSVTCAAAAAIVGAVALEERLGARLPRFALFMGAASYSLYLVHPLIGPAFPALFARYHVHLPVLAIICSLGFSLVAGAFCYLVIEIPLNTTLSGLVGRLKAVSDNRDVSKT